MKTWLIVVLLTVIVLLVLAKSTRPASRSGGGAAEGEIPEEPALSAEDQRIADAVERDLEELDR